MPAREREYGQRGLACQKRPAAKLFPAACAAGQTAERFRPPEQKKFASRDAGGRRGIRAARGSCFLSKCGNIRGAWERVKRFMRGGTAGGDVCGTWERGFFILKRNIRGVQGRGGVLAAGQLVVRQGKDIFCVTGQNIRAILPGLRPRQSHALPQTAQKPIGFWNWIPERCFAPEKGLA